MHTFLSLSVLTLSLFGSISFAAGNLETLRLTDETPLSSSKACTYEADINLGKAAALTPIQVFSLIEGSYQMQQRQPILIPAGDSTFSIHLSSYREVKLSESCPPTTTLLVVR